MVYCHMNKTDDFIIKQLVHFFLFCFFACVHVQMCVLSHSAQPDCPPHPLLPAEITQSRIVDFFPSLHRFPNTQTYVNVPLYIHSSPLQYIQKIGACLRLIIVFVSLCQDSICLCVLKITRTFFFLPCSVTGCMLSFIHTQAFSWNCKVGHVEEKRGDGGGLENEEVEVEKKERQNK